MVKGYKTVFIVVRDKCLLLCILIKLFKIKYLFIYFALLEFVTFSKLE